MKAAADKVMGHDWEVGDLEKRLAASVLAAGFRSLYPWLRVWAEAKERMEKVLGVSP